MSFFDLPDRQVVYLLEYLRDALRADQYARKFLESADEVVDGTLARPFVREVVYKGEPGYELHRANMPYLALWRKGLKPTEQTRGFYKREAQCGLGWVCLAPQGSDEHDAESWANTMANNMADLAIQYINNIPVATMEKAAVEAATVGDVDLLPWGAEGVAGFTADLVVEHTLPPYAVEDQADYDGVLLKIKLYDSATLGGDGIQGDYQGLSVEADYETGT